MKKERWFNMVLLLFLLFGAGLAVDATVIKNTFQSTASTKISENYSTECQETALEEKKCEIFSGSFCTDILSQENRTTVSRNCSETFQKTDNTVQKMIHLLEAVYDAEQNCLKIAKWLLCLVMFPGCNSTRLNTQLPCQQVCKLVHTNFCRKQWHAIINLQDILFKNVIIPNCDSMPSKEKKDCIFPKFVKDILNKQKPSKPKSILLYAILGGIIGAILLFLPLLIFLCCRKRRSRRRPKKKLSLREIREVHNNTKCIETFGETPPIYTSMETLIHALNIKMFGKENLVFDQNLGEGAFGKVVKCKTRNTHHPIAMVAVKYLKSNATEVMESNFRKEVEILSNLEHPNVIPLVGVCIEADGPMCIVLEFMKYGDLNQYIRNRSGSYHAVAASSGNLPDGVEFLTPELSFHNLLLVTKQIADGLSYLADKRFVHRDVATRNILVGEDLQVKISDFGLAQDVYGSDYYRVTSQKMLPLRWLSPEALSLGKFTIYSDIWSFGVTIWEIFTYGMQPFYGHTNEEVCQRIRCHKILERPYCCPQNIYSLMKACWKFEPTHRKKSSYIKDIIATWLEHEESFIQDSWKRLLLPPLPDRRPTVTKSRLTFLNARNEITL